METMSPSPTNRRPDPISKIRSDADYEVAVAAMNRLAVRPEGSLTAQEQARLDVFVELVAAYDARRATPHLAGARPLGVLRALLEKHGMSASDLGRLLGNRQTGHAILSGHRPLSKRRIRILSERFRLSPEAFFSVPDGANAES